MSSRGPCPCRLTERELFDAYGVKPAVLTDERLAPPPAAPPPPPTPAAVILARLAARERQLSVAQSDELRATRQPRGALTR